MANSPEESVRSIVIYGVLPTAIALVALSISAFIDIRFPDKHWFQRAGSITTVLGAYVAYIDAIRSFKLIGTTLHINSRLPYRIISVMLVVLGTLIWGYGDFLL